MFCAKLLTMEITAIPRLAAGCRLHPTEPMLLVPEGALKLAGPARDILSHVDGKQSAAAIVGHLLTQYPEAETAEIEQDVLALLERLRLRGVIRVS